MIGSVRSEEGGWAAVTAIVLTSIMLVMGLALLATVDTQGNQTRVQRNAESSFNLAEAALNAEAFLISRSWPNTPPAATSCSTVASINGNLASDSLIQDIVADSFRQDEYAPGASWKVNVCDDTGVSTDTWTDAKLGSAQGYDANGNEKLWVRAQSEVRGVRRAVAAMVVVQRPPILPQDYAILTGGMSAQLSWASDQLTGGALLGPLTTRLFNDSKMVSGGRIGVRCGLLEACVAGVFAGLSQTALKDLLVANQTVQYGSSQALSDVAITGLRAQAQLDGTYVQTVANNGSCIPSGATGEDIVFVETVGDGDQFCTIDTNAGGGAPAYRMVIVASGRIKVQGSGTVSSVVYAANRQRHNLGDDRMSRTPAPGCVGLANKVPDPCEIVRVESGARVRGAIFADGRTGDVNIYPPHSNPSNCITVDLILGIDRTVCGSQILDLLNGSITLDLPFPLPDLTIPLGNVTALSQSALMDHVITNTGGPAITYDEDVVGAITGYGSSGTVAGTFRAIAPN